MRQFGARSFDIDLETGEAVLVPAAGELFPYWDLADGVASAGFEVLSLALEVHGRPVIVTGEEGEELEALLAHGTEQPFFLEEENTDAGFEAWEFLDPLFGSGDVRVVVSGSVDPGGGRSAPILVESARADP
ncbi:MAG TPA: hypothetical protein ENJ09_05850 [Planctomycetes bacterium]|nr:hypothetical protein [Planctomycetota bacterium]